MPELVREAVLIAPTRACEVCSARRRETRETVRELDESNVRGIERATAPAVGRGGATGVAPERGSVLSSARVH